METNKWAEQWGDMQKMFLPTAALQENARHFWEIQEKLLESMRDYNDSWFDRRRVGTRAAREAADRMCAAEPGTDAFVDLFQSYQTWASGAFERIMADGFSLQKHIMALAGLASPPLVPSAGEKTVKPAQPEAKTRARSEARA